MEEIVQKKQFNLIEALTEAIAREILGGFRTRIVVGIRKPQVPIPGFLDYAEVEIRRSLA